MQCTEGWDCDLGIWGLKFFFAYNGLGAFLGPNWKVFHHGTLRNHFQGVVVAFGSRPGGEKRVKIRWKFNCIFLPLKYHEFRVDEILMSMKNRVHTCPKSHQKWFLSQIFSLKIRHFSLFLLLSAFKWRQLILASSCAGFVGVSVLANVWRGGSHWSRPRKSYPFWETAKKLCRVRKSKNGQKLGK